MKTSATKIPARRENAQLGRSCHGRSGRAENGSGSEYRLEEEDHLDQDRGGEEEDRPVGEPEEEARHHRAEDGEESDEVVRESGRDLAMAVDELHQVDEEADHHGAPNVDREGRPGRVVQRRRREGHQDRLRDQDHANTHREVVAEEDRRQEHLGSHREQEPGRGHDRGEERHEAGGDPGR